MRAPFLLALLALPVPAAADQMIAPYDTARDVARIDQCLGQTAEPESCIHQIFDACVTENESASQGGMLDWRAVDVECGARETAAWDAILNRDYRALREVVAQFNDRAPDALRDAQRAWIAYRDAECAWPTTFLGGNDAHHVYVRCPLRATAERAIELNEWLGNLQ